MAKTKRTKRNVNPKTLLGRHINLTVIGQTRQKVKRGPAILVRHLLPINTGKVYPYASTRRGGKPGTSLEMKLAPRVLVQDIPTQASPS